MPRFTILSKSEVKVLTGLANNFSDNGKTEKDLNHLLFAVNDLAVRKQTIAIRETQKLLEPTTQQKKLI